MWINGGYFVMRSEFLDDCVRARTWSRSRSIARSPPDRLLAHRHEGFWAPMDTLKEKQWLESLHESGQAPWQLWTTGREADPEIAQLASA